MAKRTDYRSQAAFAKALGVSQPTLSRYVKSTGWPLSETPPWTDADLAKAQDWINHRGANPTERTRIAALSIEEREEKIKLTRTRRLREQIETQKLRGELLSKAEVESDNLARIDQVRDALLKTGEDLRPILVEQDGVTIESVINARMVDICLVFAGERERVRSCDELAEALGIVI